MDAESTCSGNPHVTSPPGLFPKHPPFEGMLRPLYSSQRQDEEPPNIWDTSGTSGNVFAHAQASSSAPYPQELNSTWKKTTEEPIHMSIAEKSGRPKQDSDCEGCLVVITGHGPQAEVAQVFGHELLVERGGGRLEGLGEEQRNGEEKGDG